MNQPELFPDTGRALARREHPETSRQAAREIGTKLGTLQLEALKTVMRYPRSTVSEMALWMKLRDPRTLGRRLNEVVTSGSIAACEPRRCTVTGRMAQTWRAT